MAGQIRPDAPLRQRLARRHSEAARPEWTTQPRFRENLIRNRCLRTRAEKTGSPALPVFSYPYLFQLASQSKRDGHGVLTYEITNPLTVDSGRFTLLLTSALTNRRRRSAEVARPDQHGPTRGPVHLAG